MPPTRLRAPFVRTATLGVLSSLVVGGAAAIATQSAAQAAGKPCKTCHTSTTPAPTPSPTTSASPSPTPSPTQTQTSTPSPTPTPTDTSVTATPTPTPSQTSVTATPTPTLTPTSTSPTPTPSPTSSSASSPAATPPATQGSWVSPEGVKISVNTAGNSTIAQVYSLLTANALDLDVVGAHLTIKVQDQYTSQTQTTATLYGGKYTNVSSTMFLQGTTNSGFSLRPDDAIAHEYGHAWSMYWYYVAHQADWSSFKNVRWTAADGSSTLATDSRTNSSYGWQVTEVVADDYRLLLASSRAVSQRPTHLNPQLLDPRNVPGLAGFLLNSWRSS